MLINRWTLTVLAVLTYLSLQPTAQATPVQIGPIELSGSGTFTFSNPYHDREDWGTNWEITSLFGSSGDDSIFGYGVSPTTSGLPDTLSAIGGYLSETGTLTINSISSGCSITNGCNTGYLDFHQVGAGEYAGLAVIYDNHGNILASAALEGNLLITSETELSFNPDGTLALGYGTFEIVHAPEPNTSILVGIGTGILIALARRRRLSKTTGLS